MLLNNADPELCHKFMHTLGILLYNGVTHYKLIGPENTQLDILIDIQRKKWKKRILHVVGGKLNINLHAV